MVYSCKAPKGVKGESFSVLHSLHVYFPCVFALFIVSFYLIFFSCAFEQAVFERQRGAARDMAWAVFLRFLKVRLPYTRGGEVTRLEVTHLGVTCSGSLASSLIHTALTPLASLAATPLSGLTRFLLFSFPPLSLSLTPPPFSPLFFREPAAGQTGHSGGGGGRIRGSGHERR